MKRGRILGLVVLPVVVLLATASVALARPTFTVNKRVMLNSDGSITLTGTVTCDTNDTVVFVEVAPIQFRRHTGFAEGDSTTPPIICTVGAQPWSVTAPSFTGLAFKPGLASAQVDATGDNSGPGIVITQFFNLKK